MKPARIIVLIIALAAGGVAALLAGRSEPPAPVTQAPAPPAIETVDVLTAASDIPLGSTVSAAEMRWQIWPASAASAQFIRKNDRPDAINQLSGTIARSPFLAGEPIREARLIHAKGSGYMAAILPSGMRAISTDVTPESGAAGFILPNDRVDVILSRRDREAEKASGVEVHRSETILSNVRVLAIDQTVEEKGGQRVVVGKTATLELTQRQAETLAVSRTMGQLTLALRSLVDASGDKTEAPDEQNSRRGGINIVRFGVTTMTTPK
jgi:pilus assembly protein CpaB